MSNSIDNHNDVNLEADSSWRGLCRLGSWVAILLVACLATTILVGIFLGPEPATAQEYYTLLSENRLVGLLRMDIASTLHVALFGVVAFSIFGVLRGLRPGYTWLAIVLIFTGVALALGANSAGAMIHLSGRWAAASTAAQREQLLAAGEAVIASDWYKSTGGILAGLFLQGGMVLLSWVMLGSRSFRRWTALSAILANGLDALHVVVGLFLPAAGILLLSLGGPFYLIWYILLAVDLHRLGNEKSTAPITGPAAALSH